MTTSTNNTFLEAAPAALQSTHSTFEIDLAAVADLGAKAKGAYVEYVSVPSSLIGLPQSIPALIVHGNEPGLESIARELEDYRLFPARKRGTAQAQTLQSFIDLTKRHATTDSAIFADTNWKAPSLTAVIDYHKADQNGVADNCTHRIHYAFPLSDEWQAWVDHDAKAMSQEDFARWVEDHIRDLAAPNDEERLLLETEFKATVATPIELIELSRGLQVNVSSKVKNAKTLQSGEGQLIFEETHEAKSADGTSVKVPGVFILAVPAFFMGSITRVPVRLRYRVSGGNIVWLYQLYRPDLAVTGSVLDDIAIVKDATALPVYAGSPEIKV